jgi:hypothetical protein
VLEATTLDARPRCALVTAPRRQTLVLSLPADPELARLARLVSTHFFRQHGLTAAAARRQAAAVERRCRPILRAAARRARRGRAALVLVLRPQRATLEVIGRAGGEPGAFLLRIVRPDPS